MHFVVLVEESSAEAALEELLPKILDPEHSFEIIVHQGKTDLMKKLPGKLRAYRTWVPPDWRFVVLVDQDRDDCRILKARLEEIARRAGFATRGASAKDGSFQVLNRIVIEELEAWFFGDVRALRRAFPGISATLDQKARYRDPDAIASTWEALELELQRAGHFAAGLAKIKAARSIARFMDVERNRSRSFVVFRDGIKAMAR